jgi:hypothetical protein
MLTRRAFASFLGRASSVVVLGLFGGCNGSSTPIDAAVDTVPGCTAGNAGVMIANNHLHAPHSVVVSSADVAAGVDKTYDIMGIASHTHQITVTAADFATLKMAGTIMVTSTPGPAGLDHTHVVTVSCA